MPSKFRTRNVSKSSYTNYLKRAEECLHVARDSFANQKWNASTICAIHSCIAAWDAMCVYFLGKRHAGEKHNDAVSLLRTIRKEDKKLKANSNRLNKILGIKNMAEYEERLVYKPEAEYALKDCERFLDYVRKELPQ